MADSEVTPSLADVLAEHPYVWSERYCRCESGQENAEFHDLNSWAEHVAEAVLASFVVVPKDQLHQETAEQACSVSGDLREQTKPQGDSARYEWFLENYATGKSMGGPFPDYTTAGRERDLFPKGSCRIVARRPADSKEKP